MDAPTLTDEAVASLTPLQRSVWIDQEVRDASLADTSHRLGLTEVEVVQYLAEALRIVGSLRGR